MTATSQIFKIETRLSESDWTDDPSCLGCAESDNRWNGEVEALAACDELALVWGSPRCNLRVVPA